MLFRMALLLDLDGVVFKNHRAHDYVAHRCNKFVSHVTRIKNKEQARFINKSLYEKTGHTVLGLQAMGYNISVKEFNDYVYNKKLDLGEICNKELVGLEKRCRAMNLDVYIYSNAPDSWVENVLTAMNTKIPTLGNITSEHIKPNIESYNMVEAIFKNKPIMFVDDKMINIEPVLNRNNWTTFWYCPNTQATNLTKTIANLEELFT